MASTVSSGPVTMAILVLGVPSVKKNQRKLPRAILPKNIESSIKGISVVHSQSVKVPNKVSEGPVRQNAVIQTEIYGVEHLAFDGKDHESVPQMDSELMLEKTVSNGVSKATKNKVSSDKDISFVIRKKKSSTGMQTSVSLFPRKRSRTVTGTQTSGDYILKKAMASADIPIQRKTVASQVTPQKSNVKFIRKKLTCTSETQTGTTAEKKSKFDSCENTGICHVENLLHTSEKEETSHSLAECQTQTLYDSLSASTQTQLSYIENPKDKNQTVNTAGGSCLAFTPSKKLMITHNRDDGCFSQNKQSTQTGQGSIVIQDCFKGLVRKNFPNSLNFDELSSVGSTIESDIDLKGTTYSVAEIKSSCSQHVGSKQTISSTLTENQHKYFVPKSLREKSQRQQKFDTRITYTSTSNNITSSATQLSQNNQLPVHKHQITKRHFPQDAMNCYNSLTNSQSVLQPFISTTSNITFTSNCLSYSNTGVGHLENSKSVNRIELSMSAVKGKETDYNSHKLFNQVKDEMLCGKTNETANTIDMEAQTMSSTEFEQLLLTNGLFLGTSTAQNADEISDLAYLKPSNISCIGKRKTTDSIHKEIETETLSSQDFDFLNESSATTDMNTQTVTDLSGAYGPTDSDTQTASDIDFLDLVTTNMETQTLNDRDLIDLGLMDPNQVSVESVHIQIEDLKTSETQTSFTTPTVEDTTNSNKQNDITEMNLLQSDKLPNVETVNAVDKVLDATQNNSNSQWNSHKIFTKARGSKVQGSLGEKLNTTETQTEALTIENMQSDDFLTINSETQTAFDELEKLLLE